MKWFFLFALISLSLNAKVLDKTVAIVQGKAILLSDVQSLKRQVSKSPLLRNFYNLSGDVTEQRLLDRLVEDQIIQARLKELNADVSNDEVNHEIEQIAQKNKISVAQLKKVLK